ncbi:MAG: hypothetical protein Q7J28_11225 [Caulobacter sp.]|nr:hypothetical protein [Caulobacter sp.]
MARSENDDSRRADAFGAHHYEIAYGRLEQAMEVTIRGGAARPLVVGDVYTFSRPAGLYDVEVAEVTQTDGQTWDARCKVIDFIRL